MEYLKLLQLTGGVCRHIDFRDPKASERRTLEEYRQEVLNFRLNYRFRQISRMSQHNACHEAWREQFDAERLLQDLTTNVSEVAGFLGYKLAQQRARRSFWFGWFNTSVGVVFGLAVAFTGLFGMNLVELKGISVGGKFFLYAAATFVIVALLAVGLRGFIEHRLHDDDR